MGQKKDDQDQQDSFQREMLFDGLAERLCHQI